MDTLFPDAGPMVAALTAAFIPAEARRTAIELEEERSHEMRRDQDGQEVVG